MVFNESLWIRLAVDITSIAKRMVLNTEMESVDLVVVALWNVIPILTIAIKISGIMLSDKNDMTSNELIKVFPLWGIEDFGFSA